MIANRKLSNTISQPKVVQMCHYFQYFKMSHFLIIIQNPYGPNFLCLSCSPCNGEALLEHPCQYATPLRQQFQASPQVRHYMPFLSQIKGFCFYQNGNIRITIAFYCVCTGIVPGHRLYHFHECVAFVR